MNEARGNDPSLASGELEPAVPSSTSMDQIMPAVPNTTIAVAFLPGIPQVHAIPSLADEVSCHIMNPFSGLPPLHPTLPSISPPVERLLHQAGSSIGQLQTENIFSQDLRHGRYSGLMALPPPSFPLNMANSVQPQSQAFQPSADLDMVSNLGSAISSQTQITPPPPPVFQGFRPPENLRAPSTEFQGFLPPEHVQAPSTEFQSLLPPENVQTASTEALIRASHLLQPHRQRVRRRSRATRAMALAMHLHEAPDLDRTLPRGLQSAPAALSSSDASAAFSDSAAAASETAQMLEDSKLKGLEETYCSIGENFECNICFQKANEAVLTCCGHLFCWPCLYRWLHIHSYHKECPVCKGSIDGSTITPIYGRECSTLLSARYLPGGSAADRIPPRPPARRVESARQLREREDRSREREHRERERERTIDREREREQEANREDGLSSINITIEDPSVRDTGSSAPVSGSHGLADAHGDQSSNMDQQRDVEAGQPQPSSNQEAGSLGGPGMSTESFPDSAGMVETATLQDRGSGGDSGPGFHRHMSERRDQVHSAIASTARNGLNHTSGSTERMDESRQVQAAAALLSQEWEDMGNISRLVGPVNPLQAAAWMTTTQARLGNTAGTPSVDIIRSAVELPSSTQQHGTMLSVQRGLRNGPGREQLIPTAAHMSQDVGCHIGGGDEPGLSRLVAVNPPGAWLAAMRTRLSSMEKIVERLETPLHLHQYLQEAPEFLQAHSSQTVALSSFGHYGLWQVEPAQRPAAPFTPSSEHNSTHLQRNTAPSINTEASLPTRSRTRAAAAENRSAAVAASPVRHQSTVTTAAQPSAMHLISVSAHNSPIENSPSTANRTQRMLTQTATEHTTRASEASPFPNAPCNLPKPPSTSSAGGVSSRRRGRSEATTSRPSVAPVQPLSTTNTTPGSEQEEVRTFPPAAATTNEHPLPMPMPVPNRSKRSRID